MKRDILVPSTVALVLSLVLGGCGGAQPSASGAGSLPSTSEGASPMRMSFAEKVDPNYSNGSEADAIGQLDPLGSRLAPNETLGYGAKQLLTFTYQQQFDCVIQPNDDRNYSGKIAALDPSQFASPECQVGAPSTIDPTGRPVTKTDPLFVIVPFFETDKKQPAFTPALGKALKKLLGFVPDAFKAHPGVYVQCPAPKDMPGTCTMHPLQVDLGPVLAALKLVPPKTTLYVPLVDHSHIIPNNTVNQSQEWWQVIVDLVESPKAWPNAAGTKGIASVAQLRSAQRKKLVSADVPTNFFLFFSSKAMAQSMSMSQ